MIYGVIWNWWYESNLLNTVNWDSQGSEGPVKVDYNAAIEDQLYPGWLLVPESGTLELDYDNKNSPGLVKPKNDNGSIYILRDQEVWDTGHADYKSIKFERATHWDFS